MSGNGRRPVRVLGVDPGMRSIGAVLLVDGAVHSVYQEVLKDKRLSNKETIRHWLDVFDMLTDAWKPHVVGIEDFEPQPWKTNGKIPHGAVPMQRLVKALRDSALEKGIVPFIQSPDEQMKFDPEEVRMVLASKCGGKRAVTPHAVSACIHAFVVDTRYRSFRRRFKQEGGEDDG
jgi:uncharacterized protein (DUF2126 family)